MTAVSTRDAEQPCSDDCLTFENQGARVRVCVNDPGALPHVERALPVGSRMEPSSSPDVLFSLSVADDPAGGQPHRLYRGSALVGSARRLEPLVKRLESALHFAVASNARSSLFVHAGVVGWRERAILLPGRSMSGKSSLVAALLRAGADYYSDEYAVVDAEGRIHPYARPLEQRLPRGGTRQTSPERVGTRPLRAGLIVSTRYSEGGRFAPEERRPVRGLMILIANTVLVRERPRFALDHLIPVTRGATVLEGERGDADEAAAWLLRHPGVDAGGDGLPARGA